MLIAILLTCTHKMFYSSFFPLQKISSFAAAQIQCSRARDTVGKVSAEKNTFNPVIEIPHQFDGTL